MNKFLSKFSKPQRVTIGLAISFFILLIFCHNPVSGYSTTVTNHVFVSESSPDDKTLVNTCCYRDIDESLPISQWRSNEPIVNWLGYILNFFFSIITLIAIAATFIFVVFAQEKSEN